MPFKIVRNDITKMQVDAIVNTANRLPIYSDGTDSAVYEAAGVEKLLAERRKIGELEEGQVAVTPGFRLPAKYIIHAVSPLYLDGESGEEERSGASALTGDRNDVIICLYITAMAAALCGIAAVKRRQGQ